MSIHEHLPPQARKDLKEIGRTKGRELAKLARRDGQRFACAPWVHKRGKCRDKSRGHCLEMICADFLAGAHLDNGDPEILLHSISRYYKFLPGEQRQAFLENLREKAS